MIRHIQYFGCLNAGDFTLSKHLHNMNGKGMQNEQRNTHSAFL